MKTEITAFTETPVQALRWQGALEGMHEELVFGWALDLEHPGARLVVELCLDGTPIRAAIADVSRSDLGEHFAELAVTTDNCHGFVIDLNELVLGEGEVLTARIANTEQGLAGVITGGAARKASVAAASTVRGDGGLRLHGWAVDPANPARTLTVRALIGHELVAECRADIVHPSVRAYADGAHGFDLALPTRLADGAIHKLRVVDSDGNELNGSPLTICCSMSGLQDLIPGRPDSLAHRVAEIYERHLPRSLNMHAYAEWSAEFDKAPPAAANMLTAAIIISGTGDAAATKASLLSCADNVKFFEDAPFPEMFTAAVAAHCDVIACVRAGDTLAPHALIYVQEAFTLPGSKIVYTDSEHEGKPWFKPAWNADYALASDFPLELMVVRSEAACDIHATSPAEFGWAMLAQYWTDSAAIVHVPRVLYRFGSAVSNEERATRDAAAAAALVQHEPATILVPIVSAPGDRCESARRVQPTLSDEARQQRVSLVIPTRDRAELLERCITTILQHTPWPRLEIIVIDNGSVEGKTAAYFAKIAAEGVRILPMPGPFNYADLNNRAIAAATGDIIGLINNDIEILHDGWLDEIVAQLMRPNVGAVGAKLLWPNDMVQHGGVLLGVGNAAGHFGNRLAQADWGDHGRNQLVQQVSGVTAACLFLRKRDFEAAGGMDAAAFPVAFNDVDLCLKLRDAGKLIVWTPHATLLHAESASRGHEDTPQKRARSLREIDALRQRWGHMLLRDPAYHPSLNLDPNSHAFGGLALPPRPRTPRTGAFITKENKR